MKLRVPPFEEFELSESLTEGASSDKAPATVDSWLDVFDRLLRLPAGQKTAIREELRSHLTDRVRDLMLAGADRDEAMRQAVNELGEAAELAEQFRHANRYPRRRLIMNGALIGLGAAAIITAAAIVGGSPQPAFEPAVFETRQERAEHVDTLESVTIAVHPDMTPRQIVKAIADTEQLGVSIDWGSLEQAGFAPDQSLGLAAEKLSVYQILDKLATAFNDNLHGIDWRLDGKMLTIDRTIVFAYRERVLASYDIDPILQNMLERYEVEYEWATSEITSVIHELIEPEQWTGNGGELAQLRIVSGRMFVNAPIRTQEKVAWVLGELAKKNGGAAAEDDPQGAQGRSEPSVMPNPTPEERAQHADNQMAMARLRNIHMGWQIWLQMHGEEKLANLQQLVDGGMLRPHDIKSPHGPVKHGEDYWLDYGYFDLNAEAEPQRIIGIDRAMYQSADHVAVLFADGHIELLPLKGLTDRLAQPANKGVNPDLPEKRVTDQENTGVLRHALAHTDATEIAELLNNALAGELAIAADTRTNSLLVQLPRDRAESWEALLNHLDQAAAKE